MKWIEKQQRDVSPWWGVMPGISTQTAEIPGKGIESNNIIKMKRRIAYDKNNRRN